MILHSLSCCGIAKLGNTYKFNYVANYARCMQAALFLLEIFKIVCDFSDLAGHIYGFNISNPFSL